MAPTVTRQTLTATAGWNTASDPNAENGAGYIYTTTAGATYQITVPVGTTAVLLLATARADSGICTYTVGNGSPIAWNQSNSQTTPYDQHYVWYRTTSPPIFIQNPSNPPPITVTAAPGGALTTLDTAEFWQAQSTVTPQAITWFGHSIVYGILNQPPYTTPVNPHFSTSVSTWLGMTETNQAVPGEDLTNGNTLSTPNVPPGPYYLNNYSPMPGWQRAELGAAFVSTTWGNGAITPVVYPAMGQPTAQWWAQAPQIAVVMHGHNDVGYTALYDSGSHTWSNSGAGYAVARFTQRLRELVWRMNCASPNTLIFLCGICFANSLAIYPLSPPFTPLPVADVVNYNNAIATVAREMTVRNSFYIDTWTPTANNGGLALLQAGTAQSPDGTHPNAAGHELLARVIYDAISSANRTVGAV